MRRATVLEDPSFRTSFEFPRSRVESPFVVTITGLTTPTASKWRPLFEGSRDQTLPLAQERSQPSEPQRRRSDAPQAKLERHHVRAARGRARGLRRRGLRRAWW